MSYFSFIYVFFNVFFTLLGIVIGSFLNVVIYRTPMGKTISKGHSECMSCGHELAAKDLVPVFSWLFLRGKCRYCGAPVPSRYFKIETLTGAVFLLTTLLHPLSLVFLENLSIAGIFKLDALGFFLFHFAFLIAGCALISAMMIWHDTNKCFWRLPITSVSLSVVGYIVLFACVGADPLFIAKAMLFRIIRIALVPLVGFIVYLIFRQKYTKNELTLDLTFGGILAFDMYVGFANSWVISIAFALCFALLKVLSKGKKLDKYVGIIGATVVVIFLIISYIVMA